MWLTVSQAEAMIRDKRCEAVGGHRRRLRKITFRKPEPAMRGRRFKIRVGVYGAAHQQERWNNPKGCWTIDFMSKDLRLIFLAVVADCRNLT